MVAKTLYHIKIANTTYASVKMFKSRITALVADLGYEEITGDPPEGRTIIKGRQRAIQNGCFPIAVEYSTTSGTPPVKRNQTTTLLVSPEKADTVRTAIASKTYDGKPITDVRAKLRRVLVA